VLGKKVNRQMAATLLIIGGVIFGVAVWFFRDTISYYIKLYNAKQIGDRYYAEYKFINKNIKFGASEAKLDVYRPENGDGYPVLIFVHGGSWNSGEKELYAPVAQKFVPHGMVVVIPDYTLHPKVTYRAQTDEMAATIAWTIENISQFGGDPKRIIVSGHSAGAQLTALALSDPQWLKAWNHSASEVCGYIGVSSPFDINAQMTFERSKGNESKLLPAVFEGERNFANASATTYLQLGFPPALIIHGDSDTTVPFSISQTFNDKLVSLGGRSEFRLYEKTTHVGILFDALAQDPARLVTDMSGFVKNCKS